MEGLGEEQLKILSARGLKSRGDVSRTARVLRRAMAGEPVRLGFLGGSITNGGCASVKELGFAGLIADWFRRSFPASEIRDWNAGVPGTGSLIGAHRVGRDLLVHEPDLVVVEFAVNDFNPMLGETYDSMVRRILSMPNDPAVLLLHMTNENGGGAEVLHSETGDRYALPMFSLKKAVWPELEAGRMAFSDIEADTVHPNDAGHALVARMIVDFLEEVRADVLDGRAPTSLPALPPPPGEDWYRDGRMLQSLSEVPAECVGWHVSSTHPMFGPGWKASVLGASITFEYECRGIGFIYFWSGSGEMGRVAVSIDGGEPQYVDARAVDRYAAAARGIVVGQHLPQGVHRMGVTLVEGQSFEICALLVS